MADKKPLVRNIGRMQQLQSGDVLVDAGGTPYITEDHESDATHVPADPGDPPAGAAGKYTLQWDSSGELPAWYFIYSLPAYAEATPGQYLAYKNDLSPEFVWAGSNLTPTYMTYVDADGEIAGTDKITFDGTHLTFASGSALKSADALVLMPYTDKPIQVTLDGNTRGARSVDLQSSRTAATQVVSGADSFQVGSNNTVSGDGSAAFGDTNVVSGDHSLAVGTENTCSGDRTVCLGYSNEATANQAVAIGYNNNSTYNYATCIGGGCNSTSLASVAIGYGCHAADYSSFAHGRYAKSDMRGFRAFAYDMNASQGDRQGGELSLWKNTTDATPTFMAINGAAITMRAIAQMETWGFTVRVTAQQTNDDYSVARYVLNGIITRPPDGSASIKGLATTYSYEDDSSWDCTVVVSSGILRVQVTGAADNNISWQAVVQLEQIIDTPA